MPKFHITERQVTYVTYEIEAADEQAAKDAPFQQDTLEIANELEDSEVVSVVEVKDDPS